MDMLNHSAPCLTPDLEPTRQMLADLAEGDHPAAAALFEAWLVDLLLQGKLSVAEAARVGEVSEQVIRSWFQQRRITFLLDRSTAQHPPAVGPSPQFSVVLPIFNEEENIPELHRRLSAVLGNCGPYEILFVNDGSTDKSATLIRQLRALDPRVKLIGFSRNFGHQAAVSAGLDFSRGEAVLLLDADLQDPPEVLPDMIARWREGYKVVYAVRTKRKENFLKRSAYFLFYRLLQRLADIHIPLDSGDFCLMDRVVVDHFKRLPERNKFLRGLRTWLGFRQTALPYERQARQGGAPKYTFRKLVKLALDGVVSFSSFPLKVAGYLGFLTCLFGLGYLAYAVGSRIFSGDTPQGWTSIVALVLVLGGVQLLVLGVLGEYVARVYDESKGRPPYIVDEHLD